MMAKHSEFNVLAFGVFRFLAQPSVSTSNVDTSATARRASALQVPLFSIIPLRSRMQRKIQRAGFRVRAQLLH